jgi:hypothetical protein
MHAIAPWNSEGYTAAQKITPPRATYYTHIYTAGSNKQDHIIPVDLPKFNTGRKN